MDRLRSKTYTQPHGFSLIELTVAIAIIGMLAVMSVSSYDGFVARARQLETKTLVNHAYSLVEIYVSDHEIPESLVTTTVGGKGGASFCHPNPYGFNLRGCGHETGGSHGYYIIETRESGTLPYYGVMGIQRLYSQQTCVPMDSFVKLNRPLAMTNMKFYGSYPVAADAVAYTPGTLAPLMDEASCSLKLQTLPQAGN